jgi:3-hydroxybutyryl-CoA dehydrogenase
MRIAVIGAGTMGAGIAYAAAAAGLEVVLHDAAPAGLGRGLAQVDADLRGAVARGKLAQAEADAARTRVTGTAALVDAARHADAVIEAIVEDLEVKQALFRELDRLAPTALLATNTSALSVTRIVSVLAEPGRALGMHFFNPVRAMRLCELVVPDGTPEATVARAEALAQRLGKETVRVRDVAGFATSRVNAVIGNEAFHMLEQGVATAEDIDTAVRLGLNHPMGPLEMADLVGLDVRLAVVQTLHRELGERYRPAAAMERLVRAGRLGRKSGRGVYRYDADGRRIQGSANYLP